MDSNSNCRVEFERQLSDNCVEYQLFLLNNESEHDAKELEALQKAALDLSRGLTKDYIWQRDGFELEFQTEAGHAHLHGISDHGDAIDDEWLIVYMLRELTKSWPHLWVRVADSDGEFLLIEAAAALPSWLSPDMDQHRVWIHGGNLLVIPSTCPIPDETTPEADSLSLSQAIDFIREKPDCLIHDSLIQKEAFFKLMKYPRHIASSAHFSLVTMPRKLARVLHAVPNSLAPAAEAFYLRDALSLEPIFSTQPSLTFPPDDLVTVSVHFSKTLFAQLKSQHFEQPPTWQRAMDNLSSLPISNRPDRALASLEMGIKVTSGFEMLAAAKDKSGSNMARQVDALLQQVEEADVPASVAQQDLPLWPHVSRDDDESWMNISYQDLEHQVRGKGDFETQPPGTASGNAQVGIDLRKMVERFEAFFNDEKAGLDGAQDANDYSTDGGDTDDAETQPMSESTSDDAEVTFDDAAYSELMRRMMSSAQFPRLSTDSKRQNQDEDTSSKTSQLDTHDDEIQQLSAGMEAELRFHNLLQLDRIGGEQGGEQAGEEDAQGPGQVDYHVAHNLLESFKSQGGEAGPTGNLLSMLGLGLPRDEDSSD
ncbi:hypothetical protein CDD82_1519 [Ophiocordyceps australis]|uniref:Uncharacterized protein n=1 Tax=Ophiocordyceps australis TaxID=1399860 RepID=A0A2C5YGM3_9HYPO|nr:hypothetical protein CDD82_1519 [Ophiocordyceps australis]